MVGFLKNIVPKHYQSAKSKKQKHTALRTFKSANTNDNVNDLVQADCSDLQNGLRLQKTLRLLQTSVTSYLQTKLGGARKPRMASQFGKTFFNFLKFAFKRLKQGAPIYKNIRRILKSKHNIVDEYLDQFEMLLKAGSILNKWNHVLICLRWFHFDAPMNTRRGKFPIMSFEHYMKRLRKSLVKQKNRDGLQKSYENLIKDGKLPQNGLQQLNEYVSSDYQWAMSLERKDFLNPKIYNHFMSWLYSCYYMSVQGRVGGIQDMRYGQRHGLMLAHGHELSDNFKTSHFHSYQAVSSSEMSSKGTQLYVTVARPAVVGDNNDALYDDDAKLFLTNTAKPEYRMGKLVTNYFEIKTNDTDKPLHLTTNGIRSMYETTASDLHEQGLISLEQKKAVTRLGGHNGATVKRFYLKKDLGKAVTSARQVLSIEYARSPHEIDSTHSCDTTDHAPATDSALSTNPTTPVPTTFSQHDGDVTNFIGVFDDIQMGDFSDDTLEVDNNIDMDWYVDEDAILSSSSSSSSSSSAAAAAAAATATTTLENPQRSLNGTSSSAVANPLILDNPRRSNTMGAPPLPLHGCGIGQSHRPKRVLWTKDEIDKTRELYHFLIRQLPPELKRRIASVIWDYIVNKMDPAEVAKITILVISPTHKRFDTVLDFT